MGMLRSTALMRNQSRRSFIQSIEGGFYSEKNLLERDGSGYIYSGSAMVVGSEFGEGQDAELAGARIG
jgi:hypothetical protein